MVETQKSKERSRSFPVVPLKSALERLQQFEAKFGRHPAPYEKAGLAWGMEEGSSQANRYLAALKAFGLVEYQGSGKDRVVALSDDGRLYLRAQQESLRREVIKRSALRPKQLAHFWPMWGVDRPIDAICLDDLRLKYGFTDASAPQFLKVYDETIAFAGLASSDKIQSVEPVDEDEEEEAPVEPGQTVTIGAGREVKAPPSTPTLALAPDQPNERVLTTGILSRDASFRLLVTGRVGPKELEILIRKLQIDKELLAEPEEDWKV